MLVTRQHFPTEDTHTSTRTHVHLHVMVHVSLAGFLIGQTYKCGLSVFSLSGLLPVTAPAWLR